MSRRDITRTRGEPVKNSESQLQPSLQRNAGRNSRVDITHHGDITAKLLILKGCDAVMSVMSILYKPPYEALMTLSHLHTTYALSMGSFEAP